MSRKKTTATVGDGGGGNEKNTELDHSHFTKLRGSCQAPRRVPGPIELALFIDGVGEENAVPSRLVMAVCGWRDERSFRRQLERERRAGAVVCECSRGLFLPSSGEKGRDELIRHIHRGEARLKGQAVSLRSARRMLRRLETAGQITIEGEAGGGASG